MAVVAPTVDQFLTRFPSFEGSEDLIEMLIPEAMLFVSDTWLEPTLAVMYLVAHLIVTEGAADSYPVTSESLGPISMSYAVFENQDPLASTEYGRRFLRFKWLALTSPTSLGGDVIMVVGSDC